VYGEKTCGGEARVLTYATKKCGEEAGSGGGEPCGGVEDVD
jgi:hypothetical protein